MSASAPIKYKHSKPANNYKRAERKKLSRKASNHKSIEYIYGIKYPLYGKSWGASYNRASGELKKSNYRADSVA